MVLYLGFICASDLLHCTNPMPRLRNAVQGFRRDLACFAFGSYMTQPSRTGQVRAVAHGWPAAYSLNRFSAGLATPTFVPVSELAVARQASVAVECTPEQQQELSQMECSICIDDLCNEDFIVTNCGHYFHQSCIYASMARKRNCPLCRATLRDPFTTYKK